MTKNFKTKINLSIIALAGLGVGEIGITQILMSTAPMAMDQKQQAVVHPNFDDFMNKYGQGASLVQSDPSKPHPSIEKQKQEIVQLFNKYKTIDANNKLEMFKEIDFLSAKTKVSGNPNPVNGKILGVQAGAIKKYITDLMVSVNQSPTQTPNMTLALSPEEIKWLGGITVPGFNENKEREATLKLLSIWREGTKNLFGGKGFIAKDAENKIDVNQLRIMMNGGTGVQLYNGAEWGLCCGSARVNESDGTAKLGQGILVVPGLKLQMGGDIPKGFLTPEAMDFLKTRKDKPFEMVAGSSKITEGCPKLAY